MVVQVVPAWSMGWAAKKPMDLLCCLKQNLTSGEFVLRGFSLVFIVCIGALLLLYLCWIDLCPMNATLYPFIFVMSLGRWIDLTVLGVVQMIPLKTISFKTKFCLKKTLIEATTVSSLHLLCLKQLYWTPWNFVFFFFLLKPFFLLSFFF